MLLQKLNFNLPSSPPILRNSVNSKDHVPSATGSGSTVFPHSNVLLVLVLCDWEKANLKNLCCSKCRCSKSPKIVLNPWNPMYKFTGFLVGGLGRVLSHWGFFLVLFCFGYQVHSPSDPSFLHQWAMAPPHTYKHKKLQLHELALDLTLTEIGLQNCVKLPPKALFVDIWDKTDIWAKAISGALLFRLWSLR